MVNRNKDRGRGITSINHMLTHYNHSPLCLVDEFVKLPRMPCYIDLMRACVLKSKAQIKGVLDLNEWSKLKSRSIFPLVNFHSLSSTHYI